MTAQPLNLEDEAIAAEVDTWLAALDDARMRRRIVDTYLTGWCTAEFALDVLIKLDLIEHTPGARDG